MPRISPSPDLHMPVPAEYFHTSSTESPFYGSDLVGTPSKRIPLLSRLDLDLTEETCELVSSLLPPVMDATRTIQISFPLQKTTHKGNRNPTSSTCHPLVTKVPGRVKETEPSLKQSRDRHSRKTRPFNRTEYYGCRSCKRDINT